MNESRDLWYDHFRVLVTTTFPNPEFSDDMDEILSQAEWEDYFGNSTRVYENKHPFPGLLINYNNDPDEEQIMNPSCIVDFATCLTDTMSTVRMMMTPQPLIHMMDILLDMIRIDSPEGFSNKINPGYYSSAPATDMNSTRFTISTVPQKSRGTSYCSSNSDSNHDTTVAIRRKRISPG